MEEKRLKKATLGRGLDALIPTEKEEDGYIYLDIDELKPNSFQPRKDFDQKSINELSTSIKENGIIQPLIVRKTVNSYEIIAGERRWRAAQKAGLTKVPVTLKDATNQQAIELALIENLQREDLNPIEQAMAYEQLISDFGLTHEDISKKIGKERSTITNQLRLLKLPQKVKEAIKTGEISAGHARAILSLQSPILAQEVLDKILREKLSVRNTEYLIKNISKKHTDKVREVKIDSQITKLTEELKSILGTQTKITYKNGKGKIEIAYYSKEELERIIEIITNNKK